MSARDWPDPDAFAELDQTDDPGPDPYADAAAGEVVRIDDAITADHEMGFREMDAFEAADGPSAGAHVRARILWPALGFPAVIAPRAGATGSPMTQGDATRCVTVLLLSERKFLSKEEAARHLRYVPWSDRGRRHMAAGAAGTFAETDLAVRNDASEPALTMPKSRDGFGEMIAFGGNADGENGVVVTLSNHVREFYRAQGLAWLHEIRISEQASARLTGERYHLFWNNRDTKEDAPSDEMALLLEKFARPRRARLGDLWTRYGKLLLDEYEYEYGPLHPRTGPRVRSKRSEVLHPLFVERSAKSELRVGHLTDTHVSVRADVYEHNLAKAGVRVAYNNWNTSFTKAYDGAKRDTDVILITGDIIDYGRGHWGIPAARSLASDRLYQEDRNWFLFQDLLASGDAYRVPVYTILGNHDWRLNPYPPFAVAGAPSPKLLIHDHARRPVEEQERILTTAHGDGAKRAFSYQAKAENSWQLLREQTGSALKALGKMLLQTRTMDEPGSPAHTTIESVAWYLLAINPFFDYAFVLPGRQRVLMLDWAEDEDVLFPIIARGKEWPYMLWQVREAADPGPKARRCLTPQQRRLVTMFAEARGQAKVIGIHAPPIGPYPDWLDPDVLLGRKVYRNKRDARGPTHFGTKRPDGTVDAWNGHPIFAIRPKSDDRGMDADYGSFVKEREWFIRTVADPKHAVRAVLSGHIHRNGLYVVHRPGREVGRLLAGEWLVRHVVEAAVRGARPPAVSRTPEGTRGPLYINTTCAGPRGNAKHREPTDAEKRFGGLSTDPGWARLVLAADGTIASVEFRSALAPAPATSTAGGTSRELAALFEALDAETGVASATGTAWYESLFGNDDVAAPAAGSHPPASLEEQLRDPDAADAPEVLAPGARTDEVLAAQFADESAAGETGPSRRPDWAAYL